MYDDFKKSLPELPQWAKYENLSENYEKFKIKLNLNEWREELHKMHANWRDNLKMEKGLIWPYYLAYNMDVSGADLFQENVNKQGFI